jgi:hypothetical protein
MTQTTRSCIECGAPIVRTHLHGAINSLCSRECKLARRRRTRPEQPTLAQPCQGCGAPIPRTGKAGRIKEYCSDGCRPGCSVVACEDPARASGWCSRHYDRHRATGDPLTPSANLRHRGQLCAIPDCGQPRRKRKWCKYHYSAWRRRGDPASTFYHWSPRFDSCILCEAPTVPGKRRYCSASCHAAHLRAKSAGLTSPPLAVQCQVCGDSIATHRRGGRTVQRANILSCKRCRQQRHKHGASVRMMIKRDGAMCRICGGVIDVTFRAPHPMTPSIDHILPRARGGTNDPANLQLAHLYCNISKGARIVVVRTVNHP